MILEKTGKKSNAKEREANRSALTKLLMFDMQLVFDTYISSLVTEVEAARESIETYAASLEATVAERTAQLQELSTKDGLTGLFNQRHFFEQLNRELSISERMQIPLTLVYFDLNGFKKVNDTKGHKYGDLIIENVGKAVIQTIRDIDIGCRYGGDEFCIIMPKTELTQGQLVCLRLIKTFEKIAGTEVTFSFGVAQTGPEKVEDMDSLIKRADLLMYTSKARSKKKPGHYIEPLVK